ncbi:MAG: DUF2442 domain-containing protein [Sphingomonas sp.]|nr:DUF2442 domain-containing protein [Sphingomonas sp.]
MHGTPFSPEAISVEFDEDSMWVVLEDGRTIGVPLAWFPRLLKGSENARRDFFISPSGVHWDELDEDISIASLLANRLENPAPAQAA